MSRPWTSLRLVRHGSVTAVLAVLALLAASSASWAQTTITYWNMHGRAQYEEELVERFNAEHPHIQVDLIPVPGGYANASHLIAAEVSGDLPDLIYVDRGVITDLKVTGILKDLTPYIESAGWNLPAEWFPATLGTVVHRGRYYGVPRDGFPMSVLAWNKKLFAEAGLDPNSPPASMEEMPALHRRLLRLDSDGIARQLAFIPWMGVGQYGLVQALLWGSNWWDPHDQRVIVDSPRNVEAFQWLGAWAQELQPLLGRSWGSGDLVGDALAMMMVSSHNVVQFDKMGLTAQEIGIAPYPAAPGEAVHRLYMAGEGFAIPERARHPEEAWNFVVWLMAEEQAARFAHESGVPPARFDSARYYLAEYGSPLYQQMIEAMFASQTVAVPGTPFDINPAWLEMHRALLDVINLRKDARSALAEAQAAVEAKFAEYVDANGPWWE